MRYAVIGACVAGVLLVAGRPAIRWVNKEKRKEDGDKADAEAKLANSAAEKHGPKTKKAQLTSQPTQGTKGGSTSNNSEKEPEQRWFADSPVLSAVLHAAQWPLDYMEKKTGQISELPEDSVIKTERVQEDAPARMEPILPNLRLVEAKKNPIPSFSIYYKDIESEAAACISKQKAARKVMNVEPPGGKNNERGLWKDPDFGPEDSSLSPTLVGLTYKPTVNGGSSQIFADAIRQISGGQSLPWKIPRDFSTSRKHPGQREDGEGTWVYVDVGEMLESAANLKKPAATPALPALNRYFATALVLAAQNNPLICDSLIDLTYEAQGIYGVSVFVEGKWNIVWIDSYFPCYPPLTGALTERARAVFPSTTDLKEIWTMVVEKAMAKLHHSYEDMLRAPLSTLLEQLTGGDANFIELGPLRSSAGSPTSIWKQIEKAAMSRGGGGLLSIGSSSASITFLAATSRPSPPPPPKDASGNLQSDSVAMDGIRSGTTYAIVAAIEAAGQRLLLLRAPPGAGEWSGDWSPSSARWSGGEGAAVRAAADALRGSPQHDGDFWISLHDFVQRFDGLCILRTKATAEELALRAKILECVQAAGVGRAALSPGLELRYRHLMQRAVADRMAQELLSAEAPRRKKTAKNGKGGKAGPGKGAAKAKADKGVAERERIK